MKKLIFLLIATVCFSGASAQLYAADTVSVTATAENAAAVKKGVEELGKLFAVEPVQQKVQPQPAAPVASAPQKTMADVMDKAIDKVSDVVGAMAQSINGIAPEVWRIMVRQQYAKGVAFLVVPLLTVLVFIAAFYAARARYVYILPDEKNPEKIAKDEIELFWWLKMLSSIAIGLSCLWLANRITDAALFLINPEFYAIQDLLRMILNKGM